MTLDLTDDEAALLLKELNGLIDGDRYFLSDRIKTLKAIRAKIWPEPKREPLPPPPQALCPAAGGYGEEKALTSPSRMVPAKRLMVAVGHPNDAFAGITFLTVC